MPNDAGGPELAECFQFPAAVRLLWEGTQKALEEWGIDRADLVALCEIIVRLADHRLMVIEACGSPPGSEPVAEQTRHYRKLASDLRQWAAMPAPEPAWGEVAAKLRSAGAAPLECPARQKE